jgi:spore germination cell wall hydrolase CwlJ-like protein
LIADISAIESRGEPYTGQVAVNEVIFNRCLSPDFPAAPRAVIFDRRYCLQFTSVLSLGQVEATDKQYAAVAQALYGPHILPVDVIYFSVEGENSNVWGTIGGHTFCRK